MLLTSERPNFTSPSKHCFQLVYQPRVNVLSGAIAGVHAVVSALRDDGAMIDVEQKHILSINQLLQLWRWKLSHIAASAGRLRDVSVSLSLSPKLLHDDQWAFDVLQMLGEQSLPGTCIEVHLMEHGDPLNTQYIEWSFEQLQRAGVKVAIDNFPFSPANMAKMARYNFDRIKLSPSLLPDERDDAAAYNKKCALLRGLIDTVHDLGADAILTGVNSPFQADCAGALPAVEMQGSHWETLTTLESIPSSPKPTVMPTPTKKVKTCVEDKPHLAQSY